MMMKIVLALLSTLAAVADVSETGAFQGRWVVAASSWAPDVGAVTKTCFSVCGSGNSRAVGWAGQTETESATYEDSKLTFTFTEQEDGGTTTNQEAWEFESSGWAGTTTWSWVAPNDSASGTNTLTSSPALTCSDVVKTGSYTGTWTNTASSFTPDVGKKTKSSYTIKKNTNNYSVKFDGDREAIAAVWDECEKTLTFSYDQEEQGGTTTNNEIWTVATNGAITGTSTWTFKENGESDITGKTKMESSFGGGGGGGGGDSSDDSSGVSVGLIIGCVVGGICLFTIVLFLCQRSKFSSSAEPYNDSDFGADTRQQYQDKQQQQQPTVVVTSVAVPVQQMPMATAVAY